MWPVNVLVLDFHHLATPAAGVQCADNAGYNTRLGAPRRIQSRTSAGWNLLPLTPNRCDVRRPRKYARRTVSSWQPMNSATSNAVIRRFGSPLVVGDASTGVSVVVAVCADSLYVVFLIAT